MKTPELAQSSKRGRRHPESSGEGSFEGGPGQAACLLEHLNTRHTLKQPHFALLGVPW